MQYRQTDDDHIDPRLALALVEESKLLREIRAKMAKIFKTLMTKTNDQNELLKLNNARDSLIDKEGD